MRGHNQTVHVLVHVHVHVRVHGRVRGSPPGMCACTSTRTCTCTSTSTCKGGHAITSQADCWRQRSIHAEVCASVTSEQSVTSAHPVSLVAARVADPARLRECV